MTPEGKLRIRLAATMDAAGVPLTGILILPKPPVPEVPPAEDLPPEELN